MGNEKLKADMSVMEMIMIMSEGNPGAMQVAIKMVNNSRSFLDLLLCDSLDIRGSKLYMLYNDCCRKNDDKFNRTLMMLRCGVFTREEIQNNLGLIYAIPFIDDDIVMDGIPPYGEKFGPTDEKWDEYCEQNKKSFTKRLQTALGKKDYSKKI